MNKKLTILTTLHKTGMFCTSNDLAAKIEDSYPTSTEFAQIKLGRVMSTHLNGLFRSGHVVKIRIPAVATYWGIEAWIEDNVVKDTHLPEVAQVLKSDFIIKRAEK